MISFLYRFVLSISSTFWMIVVYGIKEEWSFIGDRNWLTAGILLFIPILLSFISLVLSKWFSMTNDTLMSCDEIQLADNEFLPVYLGYFFVALSIPNIYTLICIYIIVLVFSFLSQTQYFNPIFLLMGFHYYHIETSKKTRIFVVSYGRVIRSEYSCAMKSLFRKIGNQVSGTGNHQLFSASLLAHAFV